MQRARSRARVASPTESHPSPLQRHELGAFLEQPIAVLSVGTYPKPVHPLILDRLDAVAGGRRIAHGRINLRDLPYPSWLEERVPEHWKMSALVGGVALFLDGRCAAYHLGTREYKDDLRTEVVRTLSHALSGTVEDENAKSVANSFASPLRLFLAAKEATAKLAAQERPPAASDPFSVLGVRAGATKSEVDRAWRTMRAQNSVDKLEGMSAKLRRVAEEESKAVNLARDAIYKAKGW